MMNLYQSKIGNTDGILVLLTSFWAEYENSSLCIIYPLIKIVSLLNRTSLKPEYVGISRMVIYGTEIFYMI